MSYKIRSGLCLAVAFAIISAAPLVSEEAVKSPERFFGVVLNYMGSMNVLDTSTNTLAGPYLQGDLSGPIPARPVGTASTAGEPNPPLPSVELSDVVCTPDGKTAIVGWIAGFPGAGKIYFIDISNPAAPAVLGSVDMNNIGGDPVFPLDLAISPDGKWVLCTGAPFDKLVSINVATRSIADWITVTNVHEWSVAIAADGRTVLTTDFAASFRSARPMIPLPVGGVDVFLLNPADGSLQHEETIDVHDPSSWPAGVVVPPDFDLSKWEAAPVNVDISPDGNTAIVVDSLRDQAMVFRIDDPGQVTLTEVVAPGGFPRAPQENSFFPYFGQSIAFAPDGEKAYTVESYGVTPGRPSGESASENGVPSYTTLVAVLNVTGPGQVAPAGTLIPINPTRGGFGIPGLDTMAVDPGNQYLYLTNTFGGVVSKLSSSPNLRSNTPDFLSFTPLNSVAVVDLKSNTQIAEVPGTSPLEGDFTTGIAFLPGLPDLTTELKWYPWLFKGVRRVRARFHVFNFGDTAAGDFQVDVYLSMDRTLDAGDVLLKSVDLSGLPVGGRSPAIKIDYSSRVSIRDWFIIAVVDGPGAVSESDEANNFVIRKIERHPHY